MSNDAKGCYDRIAHVVLHIAMRRLGCPRPALQSMIETIQEMEHHIRTGFGDSEKCYGNNPAELPPQGVLQGNGAGPASWSCISSEDTAEVPCGKVRASVHNYGTVASILSTGPVRPATPDPQINSLSAAVDNLPLHARWSVRNLTHTDDGANIAQAMQNNQAVAVGDGSLKEQFGTSAFVIEGSDSNHRIRAVNVAPGPLKDGDSHRCEMAGLYGIVNTVNCIASLHNVQSGSITVACDNKQAIRIFKEDFIPDPKHSDFDLVLATWNLIQQSSIEWEGVHVKGHQDDKDLNRPYTRNEKLNIEMDTMAKRYWRHMFHHDDFYMPLPPQHQIHGEGWQIRKDGNKINNPKTDVLYRVICSPITRSWWARHGHISAAASHLIDWEVSGQTMEALPQWLQQWVTKTASENCGVGTTLVEWQYQEDAKCPRCDHPLETTSHVTQCQAQGAGEVWQDSMTKVDQYLEKTNTDPRIHEALLQALNCWQQMHPQDWQTLDNDIVQALQAQTTIGWQDWLEGLPALHWGKLQQYYNNLTGDSRTGKSWLKGLTKVLIQAGQNSGNIVMTTSTLRANLATKK